MPFYNTSTVQSVSESHAREFRNNVITHLIVDLMLDLQHRSL